MSDRQGVEIDYCPNCRGVWLDRGELDKILERSRAQEQQAAPYAPQHAPQHSPQYPQHADPRRSSSDYDSDRKYKHGRSRSIWHEIFD
jgi:Zn-finger nucleic acid-binding protein